MRSTISHRTAKNTSLFTNPISREDVASDDFMIRNGFREMTPEESQRSAHMFACADTVGGLMARLRNACLGLRRSLSNSRC